MTITASQRYRFAFVMDQQVGLRTQALNLQTVVDADPAVQAAWVPVCYEADPGPIGRIPGVPKSISGTLSGIREIRAGIAEAGPQDGILWATWAAKSVRDLVGSAPAFMVMDMTPVQMEAMGEHYGYTKSRARFLGGWKHRATKGLYAGAAHFFPWNEWVAQSLRTDYDVPADRITPISPGVDTDLFRPDSAARTTDGKVRLLFVGGDFQRKGGDLLLRYLEQSKNADIEAHIVTRDDVESLVPNYWGGGAPAPGIVVHKNLPNNSPELIRLYQSCDLFVLPTRADCYSLVAIEAMATGLPVIISRLGGIPNIVQPGRTGHLIEPDDYSSLASSLDHLLGDAQIRQAWGQAARAEAVERFDIRTNYAALLKMMKSLSAKGAA